ncbi:MAG: glucosidase [Candidatus Protochlamydia sp.]|nr:glucosidase [Candidatus Protochlamydia sp.]
MAGNQTAEHLRLHEHHERKANWRKWGPYLSERAWGTVREDYSDDGKAWEYSTHNQARFRAYRWNEDGIGGISDRHQYLCFALGLWNTCDPILKERLFGLNPKEGNHGEDVKEYYFYLDNIPTHSYMKMLYKYPQAAFPYSKLIEENQARNSTEPEYELSDTGIFDQKRYFDIVIEYAKASVDDILIQMTASNHGPEAAPLYLLPTLWFRNTWSWGYEKGPMDDVPWKPNLYLVERNGRSCVQADHPAHTHYLYAEEEPAWIFTENESNLKHLYGQPNASPYVKDAFGRFLIHGEVEAVNPKSKGTKVAGVYQFLVQPHQTKTIRLRLTNQPLVDPFSGFAELLSLKKNEADAFYAKIQPESLTKEEKSVQRQAFASLLWSKQLYYYDIEQWKKGDPAFPSFKRKNLRNMEWIHLVNFDVVSMPDKWEYPWYASWDLAFHCLPFALIDPDFAKRQLILMTREWYSHPNGQLPAYEWNFSDVNPPVLAWAAWRVYKIDGKQTGKHDRTFLEAIFHKLLLNFTWWVNQKDEDGNNVFQGGFLGLDNISIFDRSSPLDDSRIDQADGTAWMGFYCIVMMKISIELARTEPVYQDSATKFFEHFLRIASAMINPEEKGFSLWCNQDGFFYDALHIDSDVIPLRIRSLVGLLPLLAVETIDHVILDSMPIFKERMEWFLSKRPNYTSTMARIDNPGDGAHHLMAILTKERLIQTLEYLLDENEFLGEYGIRSLSKFHEKNPYSLHIRGTEHCVSYHPGDAEFRLIAGGNSNWRGPIWFPLNYLIIESLQKFYHYYGDSLLVDFPTGSGHKMNLKDIAAELSKRLTSLFTKKPDGTRPIYAKDSLFNQDETWQDHLLFHEFFHGDSGLGLGASHQTGWTALVAKLLQQAGRENK